MIPKNTTVFIFLFTIGILLILALYVTNRAASIHRDGFEDKKSRSQQMDDLNVSWRTILQYLSENPDKAGVFVADVKDKFFEDSCQFKQPRIDYSKLPDTYRPVFT